MSAQRSSAIGYDAPRFIEFLVESLPAINRIKLFVPPPVKPIQFDPSMMEPEKDVIRKGLAFREETKLPFWDSVFLALSRDPVDAVNLLRRATLHNPQDQGSCLVQRNDCTECRLRETIQALPNGRILAVSSAVLTHQGETLHVPMLDFHVGVSGESSVLVKSILTEMGLRGYIARSGGSYHFYGRELVNTESLITFLGKSLLFCPVADRAWIAHQLIERACGLRISPGKGYLGCPEIIDEL
jgi:hypothetical protein